jgi:4-hydroxy 2-oxovalerate aldolase
MENISLLDCTLRDGGYVNDWNFGHNKLIDIYERLCDAGVDIVEIGFLDDRRPFDINRSIMPDTSCVEKIYGTAKKRAPMTIAMIDYGTCDIKNLQRAEDTYIDGIRVIFKEYLMYDAMKFVAQVKALGYKVCAQLVSVTTYTDDKLRELARLANEVKPFAVGMVDTYGLLTPHHLEHIFSVLDDALDPEISIGYHAHNNFQLGFANGMAFLEAPSHHNKLIDGSLFGMGKSAGNAPVELLAMHLNEQYGKNYKVDSLLEAIDETVMDYYRTSPWGYKMFFYLCAKNKCHPNYVNYFMKKNTLSISNIDRMLREIEPEPKKLLYDKGIAESMFQEYMNGIGDDSDAVEKLGKVIADRKVLIVGPGKNIQLQKVRVDNFIKENDPVVISINYIPGAFNVDYVFTTKNSRYLQMSDSLHEIKNKDVKIIATSNLSPVCGEFFCVFDRGKLLEPEEQFEDNSFLMLLKILDRAGVKNVWCAGFDGYSNKESNYYNPNMEYEFIKAAANQLNRHMRKVIFEEHKHMNIEFITFSHYTEVEDINYASI